MGTLARPSSSLSDADDRHGCPSCRADIRKDYLRNQNFAEKVQYGATTQVFALRTRVFIKD
jgi:hypothetical protein